MKRAIAACALCISLFAGLVSLAQAAIPLTSLVSGIPQPGSTLRSELLQSYIYTLVRCSDGAERSCDNRLSTSAAPLAASAVCADSACGSPSSFSPDEVAIASQASQMGNNLFKHLGTLFVLDNLFRSQSDGLLSPSGASLGDVIVLYQLFFAPYPALAPAAASESANTSSPRLQFMP